MRRIRNVAVALLLAALLLSLGGCQKEVPAPPDGPVTELAYPGTYWTMSPDQVKDALSLPASGLPEDEQPADPDTGMPANYRFGAEDWEGFGASGSIAFIFDEDAADPGSYRLRQVHIFLNGGTDIQAVIDALTEQYGAPAQANETLAKWESQSKSRDYLDDDVNARLEAVFPDELSIYGPGLPLAGIDLYIFNDDDIGGALVFNGRHATLNNLAQNYALSDA